MDILEEKINNVKVAPVKIVKEYDDNDLKGKDLFETHPFNLFIASKKKSGKTSLISNIIKKTTDKDTIFYLFVSTHSIDPSWKSIIKYLDEKGCMVNVYDSIYEGKVNHLDNVINALTGNEEEPKDLKNKKAIKKMSGIIERPVKLFFGEGYKEPPPPPEPEVKKKLITPKYMFIFDDISSQLKNPAVAKYMKVHRHFLSSTIISSQYVKDLQPSAITQIDYFIAFKNFSVDKLLHIYKLLDLSLEFDDYLKLYYYATSQPYSFLYTNVRNEQTRMGFNKVISIKK